MADDSRSAKKSLQRSRGEKCAYGSRFQMLTNKHPTNTVKVHVEVSAPGLITQVFVYKLVAGETKSIGCGKASWSQPKKFKILQADFVLAE